MKVTEHPPGAPSWVDFASPDLAATTAFYTALFGWTAHAAPEEEAGGYTIFNKDGLPAAAAGPVFTEGQPPAWTWYAATADADETARKVEAAGGKVLMAPFDVLDAGRMALFIDVNGTSFAAWQPGTMRGAGVVDEPGAHSWTELMTRDPDAAAEFYGRVLGWTTKVNNLPDLPPYTEFQLDGRSVAGMMPMVGEQWPAELPDHWMVYFGVEDCDVSAERIIELGGTVSVPPTDVPGIGRFAVAGDPAGAFFAIIASAPPAG
jgi:predicted enzyme related to lactoylglutathione lyase